MKVLYCFFLIIVTVLTIALSPVWLPALLLLKIKGRLEINREMRRLVTIVKPCKNNAGDEIAAAENEQSSL